MQYSCLLYSYTWHLTNITTQKGKKIRRHIQAEGDNLNRKKRSIQHLNPRQRPAKSSNHPRRNNTADRSENTKTRPPLSPSYLCLLERWQREPNQTSRPIRKLGQLVAAGRVLHSPICSLVGLSSMTRGGGRQPAGLRS